jgi:hypothetical protein
MAAYSTRFFVGTLGSGDATLITVATGRVAVLRDLNLFCTPGGSGHATVYDNDSGANLAELHNPAAREILRWTGRQVIDAGQELHFFSDLGVDVDVWCSGYLLDA